MIEPEERTRLSLEQDGTERLKLRLQSALEERGLADESLMSCIDLALELHENDRRTYEPYNNHILRVILTLIETFEIEDKDILTAAIMHDILEDHPFDLARKHPPKDALEEIAALEADEQARRDVETRRRLGRGALIGVASLATVRYIQAVSNPIWDDSAPKHEQYSEHLRALVDEGPVGAVLIKLADFMDNAFVPPGNPENPHKRRKLDQKQFPVYGYFIQGLGRLHDVLEPATIERIMHLLEEGEARASERLRTAHTEVPRQLAS